MQIPHKKKHAVNQVQYVITNNHVKPEVKKLIFYRLIRGLLKWVRPSVKELGLEDNEIDSEIFIMSYSLMRHFDEQKSSLIPYLEKHIDWELSKLFTKLKKPIILEEQLPKEYTHTIYEDSYLENPEVFVFEEKFLGKIFTQSEKHVIQEILLEENVNYLKLSEKLDIDRRTIKERIEDIRYKLEVIYGQE